MFTLRPPRESDLIYLNAFNLSEGMDTLDTLDGITIAADSDDDPIGYVRIVHGESGDAYVYPIVVNPLWRGKGVGKALIADVTQKHGTLKLVSRGTSSDFYRVLDFKECGWDEIEPGVSEDCDHCSWREECGPLPMKLEAAARP